MRQKLVRISKPAHRQLELLAKGYGLSMASTLEKLILRSARDKFWDEVDRAYEKLWAEPKASAEELAERALFENAISDGLKDDPWIEPPSAAKSGTRTSAKRSATSKRERVRR